MPSFQYFVPLQATTKVLSLWNGSSNNAPPANWETPGFNDSGWSASSNPTNTTVTLPSGAEALAPWTTAPDRRAEFLLRTHFTAPALPPWQHYFVEVYQSGGPYIGDNEFINGTQWTGSVAAMLLDAELNMGADNVVAFRANAANVANYWPASNEGWMSFRWIFYTPDAGGQAYGWGTVTTSVNDKGVLGVGDASTHLTPTACAAVPTNIVKIVSNGKTTLFLTATGDVWSTGDASTGLRGTGSTDSSVHATPTMILSLCSDISIGQDCALALLRNADLHGWGPNASGSLGRGNTTAQASPTIIATNVTLMSAGKNFSVIMTGGVVKSAGDNTYGQLGQSTSGAAVTTYTNVTTTNFPVGFAPVDLVAGDDQLLLVFDVTGGSVVLGAGRAEFGSLGDGPYASGTGAHKIVTVAADIGFGPYTNPVKGQTVQAGLVTFFQDTSSTTVLGDGTPYGGAGDDGYDPSDGSYGHSPSIAVYGTGAGNGVLTPDGSNLFAVDGLAVCSGGSNNPSTAGNSKAVFAAFGYHVSGVSDGKLYTWGWGGAGQMGSGADPTTNIAPISVNGLTGVVGATVAEAVMFAIATVIVTARRFSYAAVIG